MGFSRARPSSQIETKGRKWQPVKEKWRLLPEFLKVRGLVKQHIDSFNHFVNVDIKKIVAAEGNRELRSDINKKFFLQYENIYIGRPCIVQDTISVPVTPHECRLREMTYAAPICVDVRYTKGHSIYVKKGMQIGRIPVMLRSGKCILNGKNEDELAKLDECPHDPGGYFVVKGAEKVVLIQEQLSKNRIIVELDSKKNICATVTSSTHERKSRTNIYIKNDKIYLKHNSLTDDIPIIILLKAMGVTSEQRIVSMIGATRENNMLRFLTASMEDSAKHGVVTSKQALEYISTKIRRNKLSMSGKRKTKSSSDSRANEARTLLAYVVLNHIPVPKYDFRQKCFYAAYMVRLCLQAENNKNLISTLR